LTLGGESWKEAAMSEPVRKLTDDELREAQGTPGLTRRMAFEGDGHWFGHVEAAPETMSGWHHHGDNVTMGYVLKGSITFEFGPEGSQKVEVAEGEYFEVPMNTVHREGNASPEAGEVLITRVGRGQLVFPVEGPDAP
jgi:quercetin dioxygenase-like cupin family protein